MENRKLNLTVVEYADQRVMTTKQLAEVFGTTANGIRNNFAHNKDRFVEGRDYYNLEGEDLKAFFDSFYKSYNNKRNDEQKQDMLCINNIDSQSGLCNQQNQFGNIQKIRNLILYTERGANRHAKILDTDEAWKQFDYIEEVYFRVKHDLLPNKKRYDASRYENKRKPNRNYVDRDMVDSLLDSVNNLSKVVDKQVAMIDKMIALSSESGHTQTIKVEQPEIKNSEQDEASANTDTNRRLITEKIENEKFANLVRSKISTLSSLNAKPFMVNIKNSYDCLRGKGISLNSLKKEYMAQKGLGTISMLAFISNCNNQALKSKYVETLDQMIERASK